MSDIDLQTPVSRRTLLRSAALAGSALAVPVACGSDTKRAAASIGLARANVSRALGGSGELPGAVRALQAFTVDLYSKIAASHAGANVVCSPYSVALALAM